MIKLPDLSLENMIEQNKKRYFCVIRQVYLEKILRENNGIYLGKNLPFVYKYDGGVLASYFVHLMHAQINQKDVAEIGSVSPLGRVWNLIPDERMEK